MLLASIGQCLAAPSANYGKKTGADWQWVDPAQGNPGGYSMDYEATINVDGTYVGKSAYRRQRLMNSAKMAGVVLSSAVASPLVGTAAALLLDAGFSYVEGKLMKPPPPPDPSQPQPYPQSSGWYRAQYSVTGYGTTAYSACKDYLEKLKAAGIITSYNLTGAGSSGQCQGTWTKGATSGTLTEVASYMGNTSCMTGYTQASGGMCNPPGYVAPQPVPVTSATDAEALSLLQPKITGMTAAAAHALADWAWKTQGVDVGVFTDYAGNVIAGPFSFPLPAKTSTSVDPVTGYRYDTNVVQAVQVAANTDMATSEADPLVLTQTETKTEKVTKPDGSTQTTTTTSTTTGGANREEQPEEAAGAFQAPAADLYTKKSKTFGEVLSGFVNTVKAAPWYAATTGWFQVSVSSASCPNWIVPKTEYTPAVPLSDVFCSTAALSMYQFAGLAVIVIAAWTAFRIAFL